MVKEKKNLNQIQASKIGASFWIYNIYSETILLK